MLYVPGEHDIYDNGAQYRERFGKNTIGDGALRRIKSGGKGYFDKCNSSSRY